MEQHPPPPAAQLLPSHSSNNNPSPNQGIPRSRSTTTATAAAAAGMTDHAAPPPGSSSSSSWNNSNQTSSSAPATSSSTIHSNSITLSSSAIMIDVTRSISMESSSGGGNSIATHGSVGSSNPTTTGSTAGAATSSTSFRASSPMPTNTNTFRRNSTTMTPIRGIGGGSPSSSNPNPTMTTTNPATAMPPPPWPTTVPTIPIITTPQRPTKTTSSTTTIPSITMDGGGVTPLLTITKSGDSALSSSSQGIGGGDNDVDAQQKVAVLLGLEELERQQADVEKRREREWEEQQRRRKQCQLMEQQQQQHQQQQGLPPLHPQHHSSNQGSSSGGGDGGSSSHNVVPSQIHLRNENQDVGDEEDTILSSDGLGGPGVLKRVVSIEKLRGSMNLRLQRLRSWSQDALHRSYADPVPTGSSVDSTQPATLTTENEVQDELGGKGGGRLLMDPTSGMIVPGFSTTTTPTNTNHSFRQGNHVKSTKKTMFPSTSASFKSSHNYNMSSEPYLDEGEIKPLVYGYLYKLGRNGHWQRRFFETNGERLTYYKNVKRTTVLATLDLCKVGEIAIDKTDPDGCTFTIQVKNRPYYLRAADKARCNDWVISLNRAREARMQVGNIQFASASMTSSKLQAEGGKIVVGGDALMGDLVYRSQTGSDDYAQPCIVISALRPRTKALMNFEDEEGNNNLHNIPPDLLTSNTAQDEEQIEATNWDIQPSALTLEQHQHGIVGVVGNSRVSNSLGVSAIKEGVSTIDEDDDDKHSVAKWQKRHSAWHVLSIRFLRWARSITHHADACRRENDVMVVPSHVVMASQQQQRNQQQLSRQEACTLDSSAVEKKGVRQQQGQGKPREMKKSVPLPDLMDSGPVTPGVECNTENDATRRSRANTESPAYGITYV